MEWVARPPAKSEGFLGSALPAARQRHPGATTTTPEARAFVEGIHALKRMAQPEEIARSALYLASHAPSFTTDTALFADGSVSINRT